MSLAEFVIEDFFTTHEVSWGNSIFVGKLPIIMQAQLLDVSRSSVYYLPQPMPDGDLQHAAH